MSSKLHLSRARAMLAANLVVLVAALPARADGETSQWDGDERASVRLIAGASREATRRAGIEIKLAPGWKTYWRYPGDSGVPPRFDFSASRNVKAVTTRYPAPHRFTDETGTSIGYKQGVVFPLEVTPRDAAKPVVLSVKIEYAVCEKLCVPAEGQAELTLEPKQKGASLDAHEALVPAPATIGGSAPLAVRAAKRAGNRILVDVAKPNGEAVDLFAEGPTPEWALPVPSPVDGAPAGQQRFSFELDGLPPNTAPEGAELTLTAVSGASAIEVPYRLD